MALTKVWVTSAGAGAATGANLANAISLATMITNINGGSAAGYKYLLSGTFARTTNTITLTGDGTAAAPLVIEGVNTTESDLFLQGRSSGGAQDTTNFPEITFTTGVFDAGGAQYLTMHCVKVTGAPTNYVLQTTARFCGKRLHVTNTNSSSSAANAFYNSGGLSTVTDCDFNTTAGGGTTAVRAVADCTFTGCRSTCPAGVGILIRSTSNVMDCTVHDCGTHGIQTDVTSTQPIITGNTVANCGSDGINLITGSTNQHVIMNNHITGCTGAAINFNTSTCTKHLGFNRFRDNGSTISGGGDWEEGASVANVTTDTGGDETDYTAAGSDDYSLIAAAPGRNKGIGYLRDIGANGTPVVTGGGGGGGGPFTIDGLEGVKAHWSAGEISGHSNGDPVSSLPESIAAWHLTSSGTTRGLYRPTGVHSLPAVELDGTDDFMVTASAKALLLKQPWVIYVVSCDASKLYNTLLALSTGSGNPTYSNAATPLCDLGWLAASGNGYANSTEHDGTTFQYAQTRSVMVPAVKALVSFGHGSGVRGVRLNGAWITQVSSSSNETYASINASLYAHFGRCSLSTPFFDGLLAEMVLLDQAIDGQVERVEGSLADKYDIALAASHIYASGPPTTLPGGGSGGTVIVIED